ncbi:MAG: ECF transporter S component [Candidatus Methanofastidiosa archaeon]|nr:ECF transporter S component [Candidatus Methanofastidiosa archaeon]HOM95420.1 ECF transporter S component [Methanofastidiosum sp.]HPC81346.1 ECF transporter S component [Methanofastidiosum sp.]HRS24993.1 ECF transporter S component [Methanofastidiosum sp.]
MAKIKDPENIGIVAVFSALAFVATRFIQIPILQTGGYLNFGEAIIYIAAIFFGPFVGGLVGAIGPALADITSPYAAFAPFTLLIKGIEGFIVGKISSTNQKNMNKLLGILIGGSVMIIGYYAVEIFVFLIPTPIALIEVPFNILQVIVGGTIAMIATKTLKNSIEEIMHR